MRHIDLLRHGQPEFPKGSCRCIGQTNSPLSAEDRQQVYSSYLPSENLNDTVACKFWKQFQTSKGIIQHCRAVARKALEIANALAMKGHSLNPELICSAALLHDIARGFPDHAAMAAQWVSREGYPNVAEVIAAHHDLNESENDSVSEKTVVFLADKLISETKEVTLEKRFADSALKCHGPEAKAAHQRQYEQAKRSYDRIQRLLK